MKLYIAIIFTLFLFCFPFGVNAQETPGGVQPFPCPAGLVCISPEAARKALQDSDTVAAQKTQIATLEQAVNDYKKLKTDLEAELAKTTGEKTGAEQMVVRLTAIIDFMLKNGRIKKYGLINF